MTVSFSELRAKEVIRLCDAENIGCVSDLILDGEKGCICSLCVTPASGLGCLFSAEQTVIAWERIRCIGRDTVLVDVAPEECCKNRCGEGQGWRKRFSRKS